MEMQTSYHLYNWQRYDLMLINCHLNAGYEADILCPRKNSWYVEEIEIKTSVSDFRADFKKTIHVMKDLVGPLRMHEWRHRSFRFLKHDALLRGELPTNYFSFLLPEDIAAKVEIPEYAGLYVYRGRGRISHEKRPKLLHKNKPSIQTMYHWARKCSFRYWDQLQNEQRRLI